MFLKSEFKRLNGPSDVPEGRYTGLCTFSKDPDADFNAAFIEYTLDGEIQPRVIDLLLIDGAGDRYLRDFIRMRDGSWRDSYGARSDELKQLIPPEILRFEVLERREVGEFFVEAGHVW